MTKAEQFVQQSNKENEETRALNFKVDHRANVSVIMHDSELNQFHWQGDPSVITFSDASKAIWWSNGYVGAWHLVDPEPAEPSQTLAEKFAEKYNGLNHHPDTKHDVTGKPDHRLDVMHGSTWFGPIEQTSTAPVYQFEDGSKAWWGEGDVWRTNSDGSGPKVHNPLRPTKPGCRCDLGLRCNGLAIYDDLVTVKSQRRRAQRELNDKVEELFQARARILLLEAELTEARDQLTQAKSAAHPDPTKGVLESLEAIEGIYKAFIIKEASGHIAIGVAIDPSHHDAIQNFLNMYHEDIFPTNTNTEVKIFIELVSA
jgi:hypothetical protein